MTEDQHTRQDPTQQYHQPDQQPEQELEHPGLESEMQPEPDYGEDTYRGSGKLEGRAAIITGGDSGIGRAVALAFAREGADVLISYLAEEEPDAQETARVVEEAGKRTVKMPGDIGEEAQCQRLVEQAVSEFGKLDILVNNAAYQIYREGLASIAPRSWSTPTARTYSRCSTCARPYCRKCGRDLASSTPARWRPTSPSLCCSTTPPPRPP